MSQYIGYDATVSKEDTKALRKRIREADNLFEVLREISRTYQFHLSCRFGDMFPVADISLFDDARYNIPIECLFPLHGRRNFKTVKQFSYAIKFTKPHSYGESLFGDKATGIHNHRGK